jgi:hypothetical protein
MEFAGTAPDWPQLRILRKEGTLSSQTEIFEHISELQGMSFIFFLLLLLLASNIIANITK